MRTFASGATRDIDNGKLDYEGFINPLCDHSFARYMHLHRKQSDGKMRDADNWQKGFGPDVAIKSLVRHMEDLKLLNRGYYVYEYRNGDYVERIVSKEPMRKPMEFYTEITKEDACNAIRFNVEAYKLDIL